MEIVTSGREFLHSRALYNKKKKKHSVFCLINPNTENKDKLKSTYLNTTGVQLKESCFEKLLNDQNTASKCLKIFFIDSCFNPEKEASVSLAVTEKA